MDIQEDFGFEEEQSRT